MTLALQPPDLIDDDGRRDALDRRDDDRHRATPGGDPPIWPPGSVFFDVYETMRRRQRAIPFARRAITRLFDLFLALVACVVASPLLIALVLVVRLTSAGPALYVHWRVGTMGRPFPCLKFRTMYRDADERLADLLTTDADLADEWNRTRKLKRDPRVTPVGRLLRKTSLDELPQLLNVVIGQMSVVGPRPIVTSETVHYGEHLPTLLSIKPGMTGLWQVSGRNDTSYAERVMLDLTYVETRTLTTDLKICARTGLLLLRPGSNGAY